MQLYFSHNFIEWNSVCFFKKHQWQRNRSSLSL